MIKDAWVIHGGSKDERLSRFSLNFPEERKEKMRGMVLGVLSAAKKK
jgi:hypothetical protein